MKKTTILLAVLVFSVNLPGALAQDAKVQETTPKKVQEKVPDNTPLQKWMDAENALIEPLSQKDRESFFILRNKYSVQRVIKIVERDVENAVKSCGKNNPDIKDKIEGRFSQWKNAVDPILVTSQKRLNEDLDKQTLVDPNEARDVLKLNDEAYEYGEKKITKQAVTSKEACENLMASMDRTEDQMVKLLKQTLLTESVIRKRDDDMKKARAAAQAKKDKAKPAKTDASKNTDEPQKAEKTH